MSYVHLPVLSGEVLEFLALKGDGIYVDATIGLGGHAENMLKRIGENGVVVGIDRDVNALAMTRDRLDDPRLHLVQSSFSGMDRVLASRNIDLADGILIDLGVSMMQLRDHGRGFSFASEARLDMRMDPSQDLSAWEVVNTYAEKDLARIIREFGEEYRDRRIARAIVARRQKKPVDTCADLAGVVMLAAGGRGRIHPATRTFQAIRIEVNRELEELRQGLSVSLHLLRKGGRLCVISYHSLEDRIVKNFIRDQAREGLLMPLTKKPVTPAPAEIRANPSARSAKLRGAEKL